MKAIVVTDQAAGMAGVRLVERPESQAEINDVVVQIHASGFTGDELTWPSTWTDRAGRDRTPSIPGHELAGVVTALGYGTLARHRTDYAGRTVHEDALPQLKVTVLEQSLPRGQAGHHEGRPHREVNVARQWCEGRVPQRPHTRPACRRDTSPSGRTPAVQSRAPSLAREAGAYVIGTGRAGARQTALDFGAQEFVDLDRDALEDVGEVDLVFDVIGGDIAKRSAGVIRAGGMLVTVTGPVEARPAGGRTIDFVVEPDRAQLSEIVQRFRHDRLRTNIGNVAALDDAVAAFRTERMKGKTIIRVRP